MLRYCLLEPGRGPGPLATGARGGLGSRNVVSRPREVAEGGGGDPQTQLPGIDSVQYREGKELPFGGQTPQPQRAAGAWVTAYLLHNGPASSGGRQA